jgi:hypothetical protein
VAQFKPSTIALTPRSSIESFDEQFETPDFKLFQNYINSTNPSKGVGEMLPVDAESESAYKKFNYQGTLDSVLGIGALSVDLQREEAYTKWIKKGVFQQKSQQRDSKFLSK